MTKFQIGEMVWQARAGQNQIWITCPECLGRGRLRVILGDDSEVSIHCVCCERGYEGSPGRIQTYAFTGKAETYIITGMQVIMLDGVPETTYAENGGSCYTKEADLFATRDEAVARAAVLVAEHEADAKKRLGYKEKQHKIWASNVAYWRGQIRHNKEEIARYEARLAVAPHNIKEADKIKSEESV
jgi:hypothetical protein